VYLYQVVLYHSTDSHTGTSRLLVPVPAGDPGMGTGTVKFYGKKYLSER
jgi:hypothetical protein